MDIRGLKYFIHAAECLNFTKAARECFITQTAMSQHIANMEKELGIRLFKRNNRNVALTPAGRDFYNRVKAIVHDFDSAVRHSQNMSDGSEGTIIIAFTSYIEGLVYMPRLKYLRENYPSIKVTAIITPARNMAEHLCRGQCDIAVCWPHDLRETEGITVLNLAEFKSHLICSSEHRLAHRECVSQEDLDNEKFIMVDLNGMPATYRTMCSDLKQFGITPPMTSNFEQYNYIEELLLAVNLNNAVALVPEYIQNNVNNPAVFLELDMHSAPTFQIAAGYLTENINPVLEITLNTLRDKRIPLNY